MNAAKKSAALKSGAKTRGGATKPAPKAAANETRKPAAEPGPETAKLGPFPKGVIRITGRTAAQVGRNYSAVVAVLKDGRDPGDVAKEQGRSASQTSRVVKIAKGELQPERLGTAGGGPTDGQGSGRFLRGD